MLGRLTIIAAAACFLAPPLSAQTATSTQAATSTRIIQCGASSRQRVQCDAGGQVTTVKLVRDLSFNRCSGSGSWGWTEGAVWADNSCRGEFEVSYRSTAGGTKRITCGTLTARREMCSAEGTVASVRVVRELGPTNRCRKASTWDNTETSIWAGNGCRAEFEVTYRSPAILPVPGPAPNTKRISCGTLSGQQVTCKTDGYATSVRLVRDLSANKCRQGSSWGNTDSLIWANKGCRGDFEVTYKDAGPTPPTPPTSTRRITCGSFSAAQVTCKTDGYATDVRLIRDLNGNRCRKGTTWGNTDSFIWANKGCRAEFEVTYRTVSQTKTITCGVLTGTQAQCQTGGNATQVRLVRELSTRRCRKGATWGNTDSFIWANNGCKAEFEVTYEGGPVPTTPNTRKVSCGTTSNAQVQCNVGSDATGVRLVRDLSGNQCRQGYNWGHTGRVIWVNRMCRGEFEVTYTRGPMPKPMPKPTPVQNTRVISCGNASGAAMSCNAFGSVATVRLQRDRSAGRCNQNESWGLDDESIWVARGCYGEFEVTYATTMKPS